MFNDLPPEVIMAIFKKLPLPSKEEMRLVCCYDADVTLIKYMKGEIVQEKANIREREARKAEERKKAHGPSPSPVDEAEMLDFNMPSSLLSSAVEEKSFTIILSFLRAINHDGSVRAMNHDGSVRRYFHGGRKSDASGCSC